MNRKPLIIMLGVVAAAGISLFAAGCSDDDASITYNPGDVIVDISGDVEYTINMGDGIITYTGSMYQLTYLLDNESLITLEGTSLTDLEITGSSGDITTLSLYDIESSLTVDGQQISISGIADGAFSGCTTLTSVDLTKYNQSVEFSIGNSAFYNCTALTSVTLPSSMDVYTNTNTIGSRAFYNCEALTSIEITDRFSTVNSYAFAYCTALESATLSSRMTTISDSLFAYDAALTSVTIPEDNRLVSIGSSAFCMTGITSFDFSAADFVYIGENAFAYSELTSATLPSTVTYVGYRAFYNCMNLASASIPFAGNYAGSTTSLDTIFGDDDDDDDDRVTMSLTITSAIDVSDSAFSNMTYLRSVSITMAEQGTYYTYGSDGAKSSNYDPCTVSEDLTLYVSYRMFYGCTSLTSVSLPAVTGIDDSAFYGCTALTTVTFTASPTYNEDTGIYTFSIGYSAFYGCESLTNSSFNNIVASATSIGRYAFAYCTSLTSVTLPDSLTYVGSYVFYGCSNISSLTVESLNYSYESDGYTYSSTLFSNVSSLFGAASYDGSYDEDSTLDFYYAYNYAVPYSLKTVTISNITTVSVSMFRGMASLTSVTINFAEVDGLEDGATVTYTIGTYAFAYCTNLVNVTMNVPDNGTLSIGSYAFASGDSNINSGYIPAVTVDTYGNATIDGWEI